MQINSTDVNVQKRSRNNQINSVNILQIEVNLERG